MERGIRVKTSKGEIGIIIGRRGEKLRLWIESAYKSVYLKPGDVARLTILIKE